MQWAIYNILVFYISLAKYSDLSSPVSFHLFIFAAFKITVKLGISDVDVAVKWHVNYHLS